MTISIMARLLAPLSEDHYLGILVIAGGAWSGAFGSFVLLYASPLMHPRMKGEMSRPI